MIRYLALALLLASGSSTETLLKKAAVPGAAVAVVDGASVRVRTFGIADAETGARVDAATVFEAASVGKVVFAYGVLRLVDDGKLDLDRPLQSYLAAPYIDDPRMQRLTARMVLSHRTGLPNWRPSGQALAFGAEPGERFGYSGEGFLLLQKVVEAVTGEPVETFMRRVVFTPLHMTETSYIWLPSYDAHKAWGHTATGARWRRRKPEGANVAATLHTTAADLGTFVSALMDGRGLSPRLKEEMVSHQSSVPECGICANPAGTAQATDIWWGLGVGMLARGDETFVWHWGDNGDFKAYIFGSRKTRRAVVVLTNGANGLRIAGELARVALGQPEQNAPVLRPLQWLGY